MSILVRNSDSGAAPSVYFSASYGDALVRGSSVVGQSWLTVESPEDGWQIPLMLSPIEHGRYDAASPYGYSGIHMNPNLGDAVRQGLWDETINTLKDRGVVSLFLRFAPFGLDDVHEASEISGLEIVHVSDTIAVDTIDEGVVWSGMKGRARTAIRKAQKLGMTADVVPADIEGVSVGGAFRSLYDSTMARLGAAAHHKYGDEYYRRLLDGLGNDLQIVTVRDDAGRAVAASLIMVDSVGVHYHLSGSEPAAARDGANNLLIWTILRWSAEHGHSLVHLGGGTSAMDSLFKFKQSFGGSVVPFFVGRAVVDAEKYALLMEARAQELGVEVDDLSATGHFPAYRGGVPSDA